MASFNRWKNSFFCPLPCLTANWVTVSHSVTLIHITQVIVIICHNFGFITLPSSLRKFPSCGGSWMVACWHLSCPSNLLQSWNCPCTICGHVLLSSLLVLSLWCEMLSSAVLCTVCPSPSGLPCVTSWVAKFVNFDAKMLVLFGNILSENQHNWFINCQIFWRVVKFRNCPL